MIRLALAAIAVVTGITIPHGSPHYDMPIRHPHYDINHGARGAHYDISGASSATFALFAGGTSGAALSGVSKLNPGGSVTINSINVAPMLVYEGRNCTSSQCVQTGSFGETLAFTENGANIATAQDTPLLDDTAGVDFGGGDYYLGPTAANDISTEDIYGEVLVRRIASGGTNTQVLAKATSTAGYSIVNQDSGGNLVRFTIADGVDTVTAVAPSLGNLGDDYFFCSFAVDRSENTTNGMMVSCAGQDGTGVNPFTVGDMTNGNRVAIGARSDGTLGFTGHFLYAAIYKQSGWFPGGATNLTQWSAFHKERWAKVVGVFPTAAGGTATPVQIVRNQAAYLDKSDSSGNHKTMFLVSPHWPMITKRKIPNNATQRSGYFAEPSETNRALQSETLSTTWVAVAATVGTDTAVAPTNATTGDTIAGSAVDTQHGITQVITPAAGIENFSGFFDPIEADFVKLEVTTVVNAFAYFNINTCAVGTVGAAALAYVEFWGHPSQGGGVMWCRCIITYSSTGIAETYRVLAATADNDDTYLGDGDADINAWGIMAGDWDGGYVGGYIPTTASPITRPATVLQYAGGGNLGGANPDKLTMRIITHAQSFDLLGATTFFEVDNAGSATLRAYYRVDNSNDNMFFTVANTTTQADINASTDVYLNTSHPYNAVAAANYFQMCVDLGVCSTIDTVGTFPASMDRIYIGSNGTSLQQPMSLISDVEIYPIVLGQ